MKDRIEELTLTNAGNGILAAQFECAIREGYAHLGIDGNKGLVEKAKLEMKVELCHDQETGEQWADVHIVKLTLPKRLPTRASIGERDGRVVVEVSQMDLPLDETPKRSTH